MSSTKLQKNESKAKKKNFFIALPSANNFGNAKVTKKREQSQEKKLFYCFAECK